MKSFKLLFFLVINVYAAMTFTCFTEYVVHENKMYKPSENLKKIFIRFSDDKNILIFKTQNDQSHYAYKNFISPSDKVDSIGVSYEANDRYLDIFNNNYLYFGLIESGLLLKAHCPEMNLNIKKMKVNEKGETIYGF